MQPNRREFASWAMAITAGWLLPRGRALVPVEIAYAGSMASVMEEGVKPAAAASLGLEVRGRAQGANALAQLIVAGSLRPDVFIAVTASPMQLVLAALTGAGPRAATPRDPLDAQPGGGPVAPARLSVGKATSATAVARTAMVLATAPGFGLDARAWWQALERPGVRFGRTDPRTDPLGRNAIYVLRAAERFYRQPGLAQRILGGVINPAEIFSEPTIAARLQSRQLDAALLYGAQPGPFHLPVIELPAAINLSEELPSMELEIEGRVYHPEPLIYYAAGLTATGQRFVDWLTGAEAQAIFRRFGYAAP